MELKEAINLRRSVRAFKPDPVPRKMIEEIMELALRAPSWGNSQPWQFAIVTGAKLDEIRQGFRARGSAEPTMDLIRPQSFPEPNDKWRSAQAARTLDTLGIKREDTAKREWWRQQGFAHFGAPCVIYIYIDRAFYYQQNGINSWPVFDCGAITLNIMLLALDRGLGAIPQAQAVFYPDIVKAVLGIPDSKLMVVGIAIGYPDKQAAINKVRSDRAPLSQVARWYGW